MPHIIENPDLFKSKKVLEARLNLTKGQVVILDPSPHAGSKGHYLAATIKVGERQVVTNHPQRTKFYCIERLADSSFKVR